MIAHRVTNLIYLSQFPRIAL